jgi:hypothetical protein
MKTSNEYITESYDDLTDAQFDLYQEYIMDNSDNSKFIITNGDTLLKAAEAEYLLEDFLTTLQK